MNPVKISLSFLCSVFITISMYGQSPCDADHIVLLTNFEFTPSELTIAPGESVAFINIEGNHTVNGISSTVTDTSFNNPMEFFLEETEGTVSGTCMGVIDFDTPGNYTFDCSLDFNAQLGMVGNIIVDAFTLLDLLQYNDTIGAWQSVYAINGYLPEILNGNQEITVFLPNDAAVDAMGELINLNQFDHVAFVDLIEALKYHIVEGVYLEEDLIPGTTLTTIQGQDLIIGESNGDLDISGGKIVQSNYTASNGVAHVIDLCLAPEGFPEATVWEIIKQSPDHTLLETAIINAGLVEELRSQDELDPSLSLPGPFTLFAPTDAAFEAISEELGIPVADLIDGQYTDNIVKTHLIGTKNPSSTLFNNQLLANYEGEFNKINIIGNDIFVEDILIETPDLQAYNGVVHVINEVIAPDLPPLEGTCGTWTLVLKNQIGNGWGDNTLEIAVNDEIIASETLISGYQSTYKFGVDAEAIVDLYYVANGGSSYSSYEVFDENNVKIFTSGSSSDSGPGSIRGLRACKKPTSCGDFELIMYDEYGDGWDFGSLDVYIDEVFYQTIDMPVGYEQSVIIPTEEGNELDFVYYGGVYQQENAYAVYNTNGIEVVSELGFNSAPGDAYGVQACPNPTNTADLEVENMSVIYPNPAYGIFSIQSNDPIRKIRILNLMGKIVYESNEVSDDINVSWLKGQNYILELQKDQKKEIHKLLLLD